MLSLAMQATSVCVQAPEAADDNAASTRVACLDAVPVGITTYNQVCGVK